MSIRSLLSLTAPLVLTVATPVAAAQGLTATERPTLVEGNEYPGELVAVSGSRLLTASRSGIRMYVDQGSAWSYETHLIPKSYPAAGDYGSSIAINGDLAAVGANLETISTFVEAGSVFVFERNGTSWPNTGKVWGNPGLIKSGQQTGTSVAISDEGVVFGGAPGSGEVLVFSESSTGVWRHRLSFSASAGGSGTGFGQALAIDGNTLLVGCLSGAAYVFTGSGTTWTQQAELVPQAPAALGTFGRHVALAGDVALVGAHAALSGRGAAYVFVRSGTTWTQEQVLQSDPAASKEFGASVAVSGSIALVGDPERDNGTVARVGSAHVFQRCGTSWSEELTFAPPLHTNTNANFAEAVAMQANRGFVGTPDQFRGIINTLTGMGYNSTTGKLIGIDRFPPAFYEVAPFPDGRPLGTVTALNPEDVTWDPVAQVYYAANSSELVTLDPATGAHTVVGPFGVSQVEALAYDPVGGLLYGSSRQTGELLSIDPTTGAATAVGNQFVSDMAFDPATRTLYGVNFTTLYVMDVPSLATSVVGLSSTASTLAFDSGTGLLFGTWSSHLLSIDPGTGQVVDLGEMGAIGGVDVWDFGTTETYCTAGVSASGCRALISADGVASATAPSGFTLSIAGVEGDKDGFFLYGTNGRQANPWGSGTSYVCVVPPRRRGGLLSGVGTQGACDGSFDQDLNARWCPTCPRPAHNPGAGAKVQAQMWYRDPQSTSNQTSSLSDALEFSVCP